LTYVAWDNSADAGAAGDADSPPVATANHNGTDDAAFILTVTSLGAGTGRYVIAGTVPGGYRLWGQDLKPA
jgi:hypothetical protein